MKNLRPALLVPVVMLAALTPTRPRAGILDGCLSEATPVGFPAAIAVCPAGDGQTLADVGARIDLVTRDPSGYTVSQIPSWDLWIQRCVDRTQCYYRDPSYADAWTDANGRTTLSGTIAAGGAGNGLRVFMMGLFVLARPDCTEPLCLDLEYRSVDINGDLVVDLLDLSVFAGAFTPSPYNPAADFSFDGQVDLVDFVIFTSHFGHACP